MFEKYSELKLEHKKLKSKTKKYVKNFLIKPSSCLAPIFPLQEIVLKWTKNINTKI